jgi:hypothetical protein
MRIAGVETGNGVRDSRKRIKPPYTGFISQIVKYGIFFGKPLDAGWGEVSNGVK